jgi:hypothetical protein
MELNLTPEAALNVLRSSDSHDLYFYSQEIAEVLQRFIDKVAVLQNLLLGLDEIEVKDLDQLLCQVKLSATMSTKLLPNLLEAISNAHID